MARGPRAPGARAPALAQRQVGSAVLPCEERVPAKPVREE